MRTATLFALAFLAASEVAAHPAATADMTPGMSKWRRDLSARAVETLLTGGPTKSGSTVHIRKLPQGVSTQSDKVPNRLEINDFVKNPKNLNLFVLALEAMQKLDQGVNSPLSYFQVAKVHGSPFGMTWDKVNAVQGNEDMGYCVHGDVQFPTWHRPYVALYEQALYDLMQTVAGQFSTADKEEYKSLAADWRLPYWDWATNAAVPASLTQEKYTVTRPNGKKESIHNPLYSYVYHPAQGRTTVEDVGDKYASFGQTLRRPRQESDGSWVMDNEAASAIMLASQKDITSETYNLLTAFSDYTEFSNHNTKRKGLYVSLESIHDTVHDLVGGDGNMGDVPVAAFDPIFWLHHCNVDRVFALWQAMHPDSYLVPTVNPYGTYSQAPNTKEDVNTPLTPFHGKGDTWITATTIRDTRNLGYGYPDIKYDEATTPQQLRDQVYETASQKYFYGRDVAAALKSVDHADDLADPKAVSNPSSYREYIVNVKAPEDALKGSYTVFVFLGDVTAPTDKLWEDKNYVGAVGVFSRANSKMAVGGQVGGTVSLTQKLLEHQQKTRDLKDFKTSTVKKFVDANIRYRVKKQDGTVVSNVSGLSLDVVSSEIRRMLRSGPGGNSDPWPTWGPIQSVHEVAPSAGAPAS